MSSRISRAGALCAALIAMAMSWCAGSAQAGLLGPLDGGGSLYSLLGVQPLNAVSAPACGATQKLKGFDVGNVGVTPSGAVCALGSLDYRFYTKYKRANGTTLTRTHTAVLFVPTFLDVDDDLLPDLVAWAGITGANNVEVRVYRALLETAPLPVSVEAIVEDPTNGGLPRKLIDYGYDARSRRAPDTFVSAMRVPILSSSAGEVPLGLNVKNTGAGTGITILGGLFNGTPAQRTQVIAGQLDYSPAPADFGIDLTIGDSYDLKLTTPAGSKLHAEARLEDGTSTQTATVDLDQLPKTLGVRYDPLGQDKRRITYSASASVPNLAVRYNDDTAGSKTVAVLAAEGLPTGMVVTQTGAAAGTLTTTGGVIGAAVAGMGDAEPKKIVTQSPYAFVYQDASSSTISARVENLKSASFSAEGAVALAAELSEPEPEGVQIKVVKPGRTVDTSISNLPSTVAVSYDPSQGKMTYKGNGTIDKVEASAHSDGPLIPSTDPSVNLIRKAYVTITGLVGTGDGVIVRIAPDGDHFSAEASQPVGSISASLASGSNLGGLPAGVSGIYLRKLKLEFIAQVRVKGLKKLVVEPDPLLLDAAFADAQEFRIDVEASSFCSGADGCGIFDDTPVVGVKGAITNLPKAFKIKRGGGGYAFDAAAGIGHVALEVDLPDSSAPAAPDGLALDITGVPAHFVVRDGGNVNGVTEGYGIEALEGGSFGEIRADMWDAGNKPDGSLPATANTVHVDEGTDDTQPQMIVRARVFDLRKVNINEPISGATTLDVSFADGVDVKPLDADLRSPTVAAKGSVPDPPTSLHLDLIARDEQKRVAYEASEPLGDLEVDLRSEAVEADLEFEDLPRVLNACFTESRSLCGGRLSPTFTSNSQQVTLPHLATLDVKLGADATQPVGFSGMVCFPPDKKPYPQNPDFVPAEPVATGCLAADGGRKYLSLFDLKISRLHFELQKGDTLETSGGAPVEDNVVRLFMDTDNLPFQGNIISFRNLGYAADGSDKKKFVAISKEANGGPRFTLKAQDYWTALDLDPVIPETEDSSPGGTLTCADYRIISDTALGDTEVSWALPIC